MSQNLTMPEPASAPALLDHVGHEGEIAGALDRLGELALLLRRHRCDAARYDLAPLGHEALQQLDVLVVDLRRVRMGERARLAATEERPASTTGAATATAAAFAAAFAASSGHASPPRASGMRASGAASRSR